MRELLASVAALAFALRLSGCGGGGVETAAANVGNVVPLCATIQARGYAGLPMRMFGYGMGDVPMDVHAFGDSLDFIFAWARVPDDFAVTCK
jgi:hypothetical protein